MASSTRRNSSWQEKCNGISYGTGTSDRDRPFAKAPCTSYVSRKTPTIPLHHSCHSRSSMVNLLRGHAAETYHRKASAKPQIALIFPPRGRASRSCGAGVLLSQKFLDAWSAPARRGSASFDGSSARSKSSQAQGLHNRAEGRGQLWRSPTFELIVFARANGAADHLKYLVGAPR